MLEEIRIKKAAQHNLKNIDVNIPRNKLVVVTGPSGSGKSSLAFDTLFAEGQRRYIECLSTYARQYIDQMEKPEVESIEGISPSISIDQKTISSNPRSTVGTVTESYDLMRLLFARVGIPHCPQCGRQVESQSAEQILTRIKENYSGKRVIFLAPVIRGRKGEYHQLFDRMSKKGFIRARVDGKFFDLDEDISLEKAKLHSIDIVLDEIEISSFLEVRIKDSIDLSMKMTEGNLLIIDEEGKERYFSSRLLCPACDISLPEFEPRSFSYNSPYGACPRCHGLGFLTRINSYGETEITDDVCPLCGGARLRKESLGVKVGGKNIYEYCVLPADRLLEELSALNFSPSKELIVSRIRKELTDRLQVMLDLGMSYLHLDRPTATLSGGEVRRVRLAAQVGVRLRGVLYVLDEPTIGLHQRDNSRLITLLKNIRDDGNSVVVVEHDEQTIRSADTILDLGPGAGERGGEAVIQGNLSQVLASQKSLTALYLKGERSVPVPKQRRKPEKWLEIIGAAEHNLKDLDVRIPLGVLTVLTGVSGSGKSTLVYDILYRRLANIFFRSKIRPGKHRDILGIENINKVVSVDQKPIGRTPRSNPATYTGVLTSLRQMFSMTQEAKVRGYTASRFSFNLPGGRCEECEGAGAKKIEMHFLPDVFVTCDRCRGRRYNKETLAVKYKGNSIADYLEMTVDEAYDYLKAHPVMKRKLGILKRVGLGYLRLGQPAPTLSGGEAQRIKLTKELGRKATGNTLYILDEPTTGLHFDDVNQLLQVLSELVELGNSIIVIEHNLDVIKYSDYIIDLGPEGGEKGGFVVACGTPEEVAQEKSSCTGKFLKALLDK
ncbi:MAG: excinuclease ABC subunit UvrA [Candidatus Aminicenantes bacterium]|nr:excinuclease ABC subunit UvrA [Candidatus Aminicenantes bacterium]